MNLLLCDLDGTLRKTKSGKTFINQPEDQKLIKGAAQALNDFKNAGWLIVGITNQGGVYHGHKTLDNAIREQKITLSLAPQLEGVYFCPDLGSTCYFVAPDSERIKYEGESYRKPGSGMLQLAIERFQPERVLMVGDRQEDEEAATSLGVHFLDADSWRRSGINVLGDYFQPS